MSDDALKPTFHGPMDPAYPCRQMPTRHCPAIYQDVCGDDRPCARYESTDETPWLPELPATAQDPSVDPGILAPEPDVYKPDQHCNDDRPRY
ncbi:hypothetical protein [Rhizocola hellebori]|nr:hypothetical protein [Rhizocola hellebori]